MDKAYNGYIEVLPEYLNLIPKPIITITSSKSKKVGKYIFYSKLNAILKNEITVANPETNKHIKVEAMWDTGSSHSGLKKSLINELELEQLSSIVCNTATGIYSTELYAAKIILANQTSILAFKTSIVQLPENSVFDCIIGIDIIGEGRFTIQSLKDNFKVSLEIA